MAAARAHDHRRADADPQLRLSLWTLHQFLGGPALPGDEPFCARPYVLETRPASGHATITVTAPQPPRLAAHALRSDCIHWLRPLVADQVVGDTQPRPAVNALAEPGTTGSNEIDSRPCSCWSENPTIRNWVG